jgi:ubiquinone/menaquinone biosynthesis C-methylase UbiE
MHKSTHGHSHAAGAATSGSVIRWARGYDRMVAALSLGRATALRAATVDLGGIRPDDHVLEVGCGTGEVALTAWRRAGARHVAGIDPAAEMIAVAQEKARAAGATIDFQVGVIEALAAQDESVDVVLSSLMMHHLPGDLKARGLAEIWRVLRPGGRLVIVDMARPSGWLTRLMPVALLHGALKVGAQDLPPLLAAAGFTAVRTGKLPMRGVGFVVGVKE